MEIWESDSNNTKDRKIVFNFAQEISSTLLDSSTECTEENEDTLQVSIRNNQFNEIHPVAVRYLGLMAVDGNIDIYYRNFRLKMFQLDKVVSPTNNTICAIKFGVQPTTMEQQSIAEEELTVYLDEPLEDSQYLTRKATQVAFIAMLWTVDNSLSS